MIEVDGKKDSEKSVLSLRLDEINIFIDKTSFINLKIIFLEIAQYTDRKTETVWT